MEFGPADLIAGVVGTVFAVIWLLQKLSDKLHWPGRNGNGKSKYPLECPMRDNHELIEISQQKLELLREIRDTLVEQKADHRVMQAYLERNK